jgi:hypothetical protein
MRKFIKYRPPTFSVERRKTPRTPLTVLKEINFPSRKPRSNAVTNPSRIDGNRSNNERRAAYGGDKPRVHACGPNSLTEWVESG